METKKTPKNPKYFCEKCKFITDNKKDYDRHIMTRKHKMETSWKQKKPLFCQYCNNMYTSRSGLYKHSKICKEKDKFYNKNTNDEIQTPISTIEKITKDNKMIKNDNPKKIKKTICCQHCTKTYAYASGLSRHMKKCHGNITSKTDNGVIIKSVCNKEVQLNDLLMKCFETMSEQTNTINKLIPKIGNNNTTNKKTNNTTNKLNLNVYLNETCKDAINLPEFMNNIKLQLSDLLSAKEDGLLLSTKNVFLKELQSTESVRRPIQCTDIKRKTMYIKEAGEWNKDIGNEKLKSAMCNLSNKYVNIVEDWKGENPNHMKTYDGQNEYIKVIHSATQNILNEERKLQSAVKEIGEITQICDQ